MPCFLNLALRSRRFLSVMDIRDSGKEERRNPPLHWIVLDILWNYRRWNRHPLCVSSFAGSGVAIHWSRFQRGEKGFNVVFGSSEVRSERSYPLHSCCDHGLEETPLHLPHQITPYPSSREFNTRPGT